MEVIYTSSVHIVKNIFLEHIVKHKLTIKHQTNKAERKKNMDFLRNENIKCFAPNGCRWVGLGSS